MPAQTQGLEKNAAFGKDDHINRASLSVEAPVA